MHWLMAAVGAIIGMGAGGAGPVAVGWIAGLLLGWQGARIRALHHRLDALEAQAANERMLERAKETARRQREAGATQADTEEPSQPGEAGFVAPRPSVQGAIAEATLASVVARQEVPSEPLQPEAFVPEEPVVEAPAVVARPLVAPVVARDITSDLPPAPNLLSRLRDWFMTGNVPVKIGMLVLLFGVAAALKYSVDAGWVYLPIPARLALIAAGGLAAIIWGWRERERRPAFGLSLQGGGIGVLLLTVFAAYRLYHLLPTGIAFGLVVVLVAGAAALAVLQDAMALAALGFLGGYLAPVLLSTGTGSHVALFSFYALLNFAVFAIAWRRYWRSLNLIGFFFTFAVGLSWGERYYVPEHFPTVEPFLVLFFLFYVAIVVLNALRAAPGRASQVIDGTLLFGTPLLAFPLQGALLQDERMALAWSAIAVAALYGALALWWLRGRRGDLLGQAFAMLALGFATLAVPLAFSARVTGATWALEGAALVWLGLRQQRRLPQVIGLLLQLLAGAMFLIWIGLRGLDSQPDERALLNGITLSLLLLSLAAHATSWLYDRSITRPRLLVWASFLLGGFWWCFVGLYEIGEHFVPWLGRGSNHELVGWVGFVALSLVLMALLRRRLPWPRPGWNVLLALLFSVALAATPPPFPLSALHGPLAGAWLLWLVATLIALASLREPRQRGLAVAHCAFFASLALVCGRALEGVAGDAGLGADWQAIFSVLPLILLVVLSARLPRLAAWPLADAFPEYSRYWFIGSGIVLGLGWIESLRFSGEVAPLPFISLLNPVELAQLFGLMAAIRLARRPEAMAWLPLIALAGFAFLSMAGLRGVHHYADQPWSLALLHNGTAQATLTVLWSIVGVTAWILGSRRSSRPLWTFGAILMGVVLLKLVLLDRQYVGNLAGIVSFIAVGLLLVLVGRIAPTPPSLAPVQQEESA